MWDSNLSAPPKISQIWRIETGVFKALYLQDFFVAQSLNLHSVFLPSIEYISFKNLFGLYVGTAFAIFWAKLLKFNIQCCDVSASASLFFYLRRRSVPRKGDNHIE